MYCKSCGKEIPEGQEFCADCAARNAANNANQNTYTPNQGPSYSNGYQQKSKMAAGLLGIFLGAFGVHNFYLGNYGKAVAQLLITLLSCFFLSEVSAIWGLIEGILLLCGSINTDGNGMPLKD